MKIFEEAIQNVKKRRAKNAVEMTDYDHFRAEIFYRNSISRLQKNKISRTGHAIDFPDNTLQKKHAF